MKRIFCILLLLCLYFYGFGQSTLPPEKALAIGDTMPDVLMDELYNYPSKTVRFAAFQKELTIIDFWATWCGYCIATFSQLQALQTKYSRELQLLMVNASVDDNAKKVTGFLQKRQARTNKAFTLPYLLGDTLFAKLFPHRAIPHCVWINKAGKIIAITESDAITAENIEAVLKNVPVAFEYKSDATAADHNSNLLPDADTATGVLYRSLITSEKKGRKTSMVYEAADDGNIKLMRVLNYSLLGLYQKAFRDVFKHGSNRLQVDDNVQAAFELGIHEKWRKRYCYELQVGSMPRAAAMNALATDLERCFNITAVAEKKQLAGYALSAGKSIDGLRTKGGPPAEDIDEESIRKHIINGNMEALVTMLEMILKQPVINHTGLGHNIDIDFPQDIFSYGPAQVQAFLKPLGINMVAATELLWVPRLKKTN